MSGAIAGLVITAGTTTMSFIGAGKQKRMEEAASRSAAQAMAEVEKELTKNEMKANFFDFPFSEYISPAFSAIVSTSQHC